MFLAGTVPAPCLRACLNDESDGQYWNSDTPKWRNSHIRTQTFCHVPGYMSGIASPRTKIRQFNSAHCTTFVYDFSRFQTIRHDVAIAKGRGRNVRFSAICCLSRLLTIYGCTLHDFWGRICLRLLAIWACKVDELLHSWPISQLCMLIHKIYFHYSWDRNSWRPALSTSLHGCRLVQCSDSKMMMQIMLYFA